VQRIHKGVQDHIRLRKSFIIFIVVYSWFGPRRILGCRVMSWLSSSATKSTILWLRFEIRLTKMPKIKPWSVLFQRKAKNSRFNNSRLKLCAIRNLTSCMLLSMPRRRPNMMRFCLPSANTLSFSRRTRICWRICGSNWLGTWICQILQWLQFSAKSTINAILNLWSKIHWSDLSLRKLPKPLSRAKVVSSWLLT